MSDILELIDNAIAGTTGPDAMRWTPERPKPIARPDLAMRRLVMLNSMGVQPARIVQVVGLDQVQAAFAEIGRKFAIVAAALKPVIEQIGRNLTAAFANLGKFQVAMEREQAAMEREQAARRSRVSRMHAAYGRRKR